MRPVRLPLGRPVRLVPHDGPEVGVMLALVLSAVLAQDGGVYVYDRAALLLPSGAILTVDAGVALDAPVALERANELERLRAERHTPSWVATALSAVALGVWVADRVVTWTRSP